MLIINTFSFTKFLLFSHPHKSLSTPFNRATTPCSLIFLLISPSKINFIFPRIRKFALFNLKQCNHEKNFKVEVWIDGKPFHTLHGEVTHVRNRRLALTLVFRDLLRGLYPPGDRQASNEELRTLLTLRTLANILERQFRHQQALKRGEDL